MLGVFRHFAHLGDVILNGIVGGVAPPTGTPMGLLLALSF